MQTIQLQIEKMHCGGCAANVTRVLQGIPGVEVTKVTVGSATFQLDPQQTTPQHVVERLGQAGFPARLA